MKNTVTRLFTYLFLSLPFLSFAQNGSGNISGKVQDPDSAPVAFANVVLYRTADSSMAKVEVTDEEGAFEMIGIPAGQYRLEISFVGLPSYRSERFALAAGQKMDFQTVQLK